MFEINSHMKFDHVFKGKRNNLGDIFDPSNEQRRQSNFITYIVYPIRQERYFLGHSKKESTLYNKKPSIDHKTLLQRKVRNVRNLEPFL